LKALVVVDMQEDYIGEKSKYKFLNKQEIINNINNRITELKQENAIIIYMKNMRKGYTSDFVKGLYITADLIFIKEKSSSFSSDDFVTYIFSNNINDIEVVGIDGNCCVKTTAIDGIKNDLTVTIPLSCIGAINKERFLKTKQELIKQQVKIID